jgi:hypothetical protein
MLGAMRPRLGRARWTRPWILAAGALIAAHSACSSDLFHSTDWPTRCDTKPDDPGCPGTTSTGAGGAGSTTATTSSSGGGKGGGSATTATTGAGGSAGGGGTKDGG